jgi:hypothetical protein
MARKPEGKRIHPATASGTHFDRLTEDNTVNKRAGNESTTTGIIVHNLAANVHIGARNLAVEHSLCTVMSVSDHKMSNFSSSKQGNDITLASEVWLQCSWRHRFQNSVEAQECRKCNKCSGTPSLRKFSKHTFSRTESSMAALLASLSSWLFCKSRNLQKSTSSCLLDLAAPSERLLSSNSFEKSTFVVV